MPYFQLRITFNELRNKERCLRAVKALIRHYELVTYSTGIEELNGYGEPCDQHLHFNFTADIDRVNPKRCIQDWLRRYFSKLDIELKGNKQWSLQMVDEPKDFDRWFRYPLKEGPIYMQISKNMPPFQFTKKEGWTKEDKSSFDELCHLARIEKNDAVAANILRREKLRNKDQFKIKLYDFIKEKDLQNPRKEAIWCLIFEYYRKIEKPINFTTVEGYTNLWLADHGYLAAEDAFKIAHNNDN